MRVPFLDLPQHNTTLKHDILKVWESLLESAAFIGGEQVDRFEDEFARVCDTQYCVSVGSGTDALRFIFQGLGLKPGDEVITVPNTFIATTETITQAGGKIVFCDIDPHTYNIDCGQIEEKISSRTVGIVPVHLYGQPADMDEINCIAEKHGLWVVEDSCQAHLARYKGRRTGSLAHAAAFSFYPGKNLGACGEAGAVTTNDQALAEKIRTLRNHGQAQKYYHDIEGYNGRCDALQAAALRVKLPYLQEWCDLRGKKAAWYYDALAQSGVVLPHVSPDRTHVFHLFVILVEQRERVIQHLSGKGVSTGLHYPLPLHLQKVYTHMNFRPGSFPVAENAAERLLSLPIFPEITEEQLDYVCNCLKEVL